MNRTMEHIEHLKLMDDHEVEKIYGRYYKIDRVYDLADFICIMEQFLAEELFKNHMYIKL